VGFPGWHIECSAMAMKYLGEQADIHCGGIDHIPVHHTNEIAQSESATGRPWVRWWMHGEFLVMAKTDSAQAEKMAKSTGGFLRMDTLVERGYDPLAYRYFCLNAHYRAQLAFSWEGLDAAATAFERIRIRAIELRTAAGTAPASTQAGQAHLAEFREAVEDDLNMPRALAALWGLLRDSALAAPIAWATLLEMDRVLGFDLQNIQERKTTVSADQAGEIQKLIDERNAARKSKNFARADEIRKQLAANGFDLKDTPEGTKLIPRKP
jgi:cysteinyl-tRNA synthetase